jgi:outer membrane scaffolding protein for murein synthesis (MipA/OmpV family)
VGARIAALVALALGPAAAVADEPLWEAGLGAAAISFPDYRGSDRRRAYVLPSPYFVYRGDFFKSDRYGMRGVFFASDRVDLNVSVGASLPVSSSRDPARDGMPDLKPSIELGPSLYLTLWRSDDRNVKLDARFPVRGALTVESSPRFAGTQFFPHLNLDLRDPFGEPGWNLGLVAGPVLADARYNRYFYEVAPRYATATRPAYAASGGYGGMQFIAALSKRFPAFWVGGFARYDSLRGATFEASPLVTSKRYAAGGIGISWILGESAQRVPSEAAR